jgi:hypothetical protein
MEERKEGRKGGRKEGREGEIDVPGIFTDSSKTSHLVYDTDQISNSLSSCYEILSRKNDIKKLQ